MNPPRPTLRGPVLVCVTLFVAAVGLFNYGLCRWLAPYRATVQPLETRGLWIAPAEGGNYAACFRKTFQLAAGARNAWVAIAACDSYEVMVNGDTAARQFLWRPTRPFQNGVSEDGQKLDFTLPLLGLNFPREYQWAGHRNYRLPIFIDLTPFLRTGRNVLCVEVETHRLPARMLLDGEVLARTGERVDLHSDESLKAMPVPPDGSLLNWVTCAYQDFDWTAASRVPPPPGGLLRTFDPRVFTTPFDAPWLRAPEGGGVGESNEFEQTWTLSATPADASLRIVANRAYDLVINGQRVNAPARADLDGGEWIIDTQKAADPSTQPELLDPDEADTLFVGSEFESAPHGDPTANDFHPVEDTENRTRERPNATDADNMVPGDLDPVKEHSRVSQDFSPATDLPAKLVPKALSRNRQLGSFNLYDVRWMLHAGRNTVAVRLLPSDAATPLNWAAQFALDGQVANDHALSTADPGWTCRPQRPDGSYGARAPAVSGGPSDSGKLPKKSFRGCMFDGSAKLHHWLAIALLTTLAAGTGAGVAWWRQRDVLWPARGGGADREAVRQFLGRFAGVLLVPVAVLLGALLVEATWAERDEILWFRQGVTWAFVIGAALVLMGLAAWRFSRPDMAGDLLSASSRRAAGGITLLPRTRAWTILLISLLMFCAFLRAYRLDFQPLDDDEYASVQATMAIAASGVPRFTSEVFYTRSPLYHYLTGAVVWIFGENLWAIRLPSVAFGVATAWLIYLFGAQILRSRWLGLGAMVLFSIHPFTIFSGHIGRFYQQQQFFALLTLYCFCRGMVTAQDMRWRYAMLAALLAAVLSQELSLVLGAPLLVGYLLFADRKPWPDEVRFIVAAGGVLALMAIDILVFQTACLTRTEGISPNIEPALKPYFFYPMNFFTLFIGYSRLHLGLSVLLMIGFPLAIRERTRARAALYFVLFAGVAFSVLFITTASLRYQYWLLPLWILLGLYSTKALLATLLRVAFQDGRGRHGWLTPLLASILYIVVVLSFSPWRIVGSYDCKLLPDSTSAFRYVQSQLRAGDVVAATEPHPHAALIETGRVDYDLSVPLLTDFVYLKDGRLVDRNGSAEVISTLSQLQSACTRHRRLWVVINREKFRSRGRNIRWEYPGARVELFLRQNFQVKYRASLWSVYLWDASAGGYHPFREDRTAGN